MTSGNQYDLTSVVLPLIPLVEKAYGREECREQLNAIDQVIDVPESIIIGHSFYRKDFRGILQQIYGMDKAVPPLCQKNRGKFHNESVIGVFKCFILFIRVFPLEIRPALRKYSANLYSSVCLGSLPGKEEMA